MGMMDPIGAHEICSCSLTVDVPFKHDVYMILLGCSLGVIVFWFVTMAASVVQHGCLPGCAGLWQRATCRSRGGSSDISFERKVAEVVMDRLLQHAKAFVEGAVLLFTPLAAGLGLFVCVLRVKLDYSIDQDAMAVITGIALAAAMAVLYLGIFKHHLTKIVAGLVSSVFFLVPLTTLYLVETQSGYLLLSEIVHLSQLLTALLFPIPRLVIPLNVISVTVQAVFIYGGNTPLDIAESLLVNLLVSFAYNMVLITAVRRSLFSEAQALVQVRVATCMEATVENLLNVMCDAVFSLKDNLTFKEPSPKLMALLCRASLPRSDQMPSFFEYLAPPDVPRFKEFLAGCTEDSQARSIHVHLLDSVGTPVPVQLFHTIVPDLDDLPNHVFGVKEDGEDWDHYPTALHGLREDNKSNDWSSNSSSVGRISTWGDIGKARVLIRTRMDLEVLRESQPSRSLFGFSEDMGNSDNFFSRFQKPNELIRWLEFIHTIAARGVTQHDRMLFGEVQFRDVSRGLEYSAELRAFVRTAHQSAPSPSGPGRYDFRSDMRAVELELHFDTKRDDAEARRGTGRSPRRGGNQTASDAAPSAENAAVPALRMQI